MTHSLAIRSNPDNPDHHLWNNNGTWFVHYTIHRPDFTKHRVRISLKTASRVIARARRDRRFAQFQNLVGRDRRARRTLKGAQHEN